MMRNLGIFLAGLITGLAAGGIGMHFYSKKKCDEMIDREIEAYAEYTEAKIEHMKTLVAEGSIDEPERNDEEVSNNEGVKKYHHQEEGISSLSSRQPFGKKETKEKEMAEDKKQEDVVEIEEQDFLKTFVGPTGGPYDKVTLDLLWTGIEDNPHDWENHLYWGYGTDNEMLAMLKPEYKGLSMTDILGDMWRWCSDYLIDEEDHTELNEVGSFFVRNHKLHQDIECVVHNMKEESYDE